MDVPEDMRLTSQYRATLGHKVQHSFQPNCEFWEVSSIVVLILASSHEIFNYSR